MTKRQQNELEVWRYFIPPGTWAEENSEDIKKFFECSERGQHKDEMTRSAFLPEGRTYAHALRWGKIWAYRNVHEIWEPALLGGEGGWCGYCELIEDMPAPVIEFVKKEMFQGIDSEAIENCRDN